MNRCARFCRPLPNHSATPPEKAGYESSNPLAESDEPLHPLRLMVSAEEGYPSARARRRDPQAIAGARRQDDVDAELRRGERVVDEPRVRHDEHKLGAGRCLDGLGREGEVSRLDPRPRRASLDPPVRHSQLAAAFRDEAPQRGEDERAECREAEAEEPSPETGPGSRSRFDCRGVVSLWRSCGVTHPDRLLPRRFPRRRSGED